MKTVDIVIPSYKPDKCLMQLIQRLERQTYPIGKIILMNTEERYWNQLIYGTKFLEQFQNVEIYHISKKEFDHGKTRNRGVKHSTAAYFVCMTQDALPLNDTLIEEAVRALEEEPAIAVAYARQLPNANCSLMEQFTRSFNYPAEAAIKSQADIGRLGIKTYFCSNVCAIYQREIFDRLGGFVSPAIFNEDMIFAAGAVKAGYKIAYAAKAEVIHSHNYTNKQQFQRNFDMGVSQADYPEIFLEVPAEGEGIRMVRETADFLRVNGKSKMILSLYVKSACKFFGYRLGRCYQKLPKQLVRKCTMSPEYWNRNDKNTF